ncbi:MAG: gfo/Idh/MocA family oxidoreductase [Acidimicrobiia bacterium]|nr:gfo/Idh/MocA family oxidoreductase [Acidimicrobiia bacterium]
MTARLGIGVIGFGWMGQTHARSYRVLPTRFDTAFTPEVVMVADTDQARLDHAESRFGVDRVTTDWRRLVSDPAVDVVDIAAPTARHREIAEVAASLGKPVFCEKPVGIDPAATAAIEKAARKAGVVTGAGFNYRWAPLVQHTRGLIDTGRLGDLTHYRGRFFSMYGSDRMGTLSWRYLESEAGYGVLTDLMSHAIDMAHYLGGPIRRLVATRNTFVTERPLPRPDTESHYQRGRPEDPTGEVTNEDYIGALVEFESGARGTLEADRSMVGPQSQMAFEVNGTKGAASWDHEKLNQLRLYLADRKAPSGYKELLSGDEYPHHGAFVPGGGNSIGFDDLKTIEAYEFLTSVVDDRRFRPDFGDALAVASVADTMVRSWDSERWEDVRDLHTP